MRLHTIEAMNRKQYEREKVCFKPWATMSLSEVSPKLWTESSNSWHTFVFVVTEWNNNIKSNFLSRYIFLVLILDSGLSSFHATTVLCIFSYCLPIFNRMSFYPTTNKNRSSLSLNVTRSHLYLWVTVQITFTLYFQSSLKEIIDLKIDKIKTPVVFIAMKLVSSLWRWRWKWRYFKTKYWGEYLPKRNELSSMQRKFHFEELDDL